MVVHVKVRVRVRLFLREGGKVLLYLNGGERVSIFYYKDVRIH